jgi:hypothetical protein
MDQKNPDLAALRDAQQAAAKAWQEFLNAISQGLAHVNPVVTTTLLQAYRDTAQRFADLFPDHPYPKSCVDQADEWLKEIGRAK